MSNKAVQANGEEGELMQILEDGVKSVLRNREASTSERLAAITAGAKLLMIKHKISGSDEKGFFE